MGSFYLYLRRELHAYIYKCYTVYTVFIKERRYTKGIILVNLNVLNMYIRDIVAIFKLFARAYPLINFFYITTTILLYKYYIVIYIYLCLF